MLKCPECRNEQVSVWAEVWVDFYDGGRRQVADEELDEFEPKFGDEVLCRACGVSWIYGRPILANRSGGR